MLLEIALACSCPKEVRIVFFFLETYIIMLFYKRRKKSSVLDNYTFGSTARRSMGSCRGIAQPGFTNSSNFDEIRQNATESA
jgi:hypothetical protein